MANRCGRKYSNDMKVKRIVTNIAATDVSKARHFYVDVFGLNVVVRQGLFQARAGLEGCAPLIFIA